MFERVTHCAFSDESEYNTGQYQSIGMISIPQDDLENIESTFLSICSKYGFNNLRHVKWHELRSANMRFCVSEIINLTINYAVNEKLRADILVWDTQDSRHNISGRDDGENLARMYYKLLKDVLMKRWPKNSVWEVYADQNNIIDWEKLVKLLNNKGLIQFNEQDKDGNFKLNILNQYKLKIIPSAPQKKPLIQLADIFAGMAIYSRTNFEKWKESKIPQVQTRLFPIEIKLSRRDRERCLVLEAFKNTCSGKKMGVSLNSTKGLKTWQPTNPINFWFYQPQHEKDKAPTH
ncbi:DUF3800 domain-containing protein [Methanobacterium alkalithermotolerans]|uniref:DUF3800 domain-containing protein n=1 Tax=Methanobacterium alkalithermotolerans TaxID=2731220 RepID=A0A8T8K6G0_9EURY|nr:DUF3800 domain-containing protein [Methanobacterium alkalithermotolerans]QUH24218.1 DUF3800 domain-containing protein [Methanobacterium alkalithermotolerans]